MFVTVKRTESIEVTHLHAICGVRYWEDASVNGVEDQDGTLIPFRDGDAWKPIIDLDSGVVVGWPQGTTASVHYKVCDDGTYELRGPDGKIVSEINGYVPSIMCPEGNGYGDYVIMKIDEHGKIGGWGSDLSDFEGDAQ